jgi:branched-chain amino acid transport system substrate-binding protein
LLSLTAVVAACSSSSSGSSGSGGGATSSTPVNTAILGSPRAASGAALTVGYIYDGQSQGVDARPELTAAQAAVKYVNEYLGGIAGRPLALKPCATSSTPAGATDCANQMLAAQVPIVLSAAPGEPAPVLKVLEPAKVPYMAYAAAEQTLLLSPDSYVITNAVGGIGAPIKVAADNGSKKVSMVLIDLPAAVGPVEGFSTPLFKKQGISVSYVPIAPGTPDMTPQLQGAISGGAQQFSVIGDPPFCISALSGLKTLGFTGKIIINSQCYDERVPKSVPGGVAGVMIATSESLDSKDPEVALYEAVLAKYAPNLKPHSAANSGGFAAVVGFARAMAAASGPITPDSVRSTIESMPQQPMPLLAGQTFQCNRKAVSLTPSACSRAVTILTLDASGKVAKAEPFDPTPYTLLG